MAFIALLLAQAAETSPWYVNLIPIALMFGVFYFVLIMPARKRQKAHEAMVSAVASGDKVITNGGLIGTITKIEEKTLKVRLAPGFEVTLLRSHIAGKAQEENS